MPSVLDKKSRTYKNASKPLTLGVRAEWLANVSELPALLPTGSHGVHAPGRTQAVAAFALLTLADCYTMARGHEEA